MPHIMEAGKFKAECLKIMDEIQRTHTSLIITKRNVPIVEIRPIEEKKTPLFGRLKGTVCIHGDIIEPIGEEWDACREDH